MEQPRNTGMASSSGKQKSLYRELTTALVALVSLVSIAANLVNYLYFARQAEALQKSTSSEYSAYLRQALEWPLWNVDDELVGKVGSAFASNAGIASLTIRDDQQRVVYHQGKPDGDQVKREIAIEHKGRKIGSVEIGLTLRVYKERHRQQLLAGIATMALLILVLFSATRWILSRSLRKPIDAFVGATGAMVEGKYLQIDLPETYVEFSPILSGFKTMSDAVASRESSLRQINENLALEIVERKKAEEAAQAASQYSRSLIEASLDPLVTISSEGKINDANAATERVTGVNRAGLIGSDFADYFTEPDKAREGYRQCFDKGFVADYPLALRRRDGRITDVLYNASVYRDEAGKVLGVFAAARDVTERNKAEREVAQLSVKNRLILDSAGEGIYGLDTDGLCTFANPTALQLLGFSTEELIGRHSHPIFHHTKPEGRRYPEEECPVQAAYKQGEVHRGDDLYWRKDGSSFPVEFISTPILESGKITGAVVAFRDITDRKLAEEALRESEARFRKLVKVLPIPLCYVSKYDAIEYMNDRFAQVFGYTLEDIPNSEAWWRLAYPDEAYRRQVLATWNAAVQAAAKSGQDIQPVVYRVTCKNGDVRTMEISGVTLGDDFLATFIDMTAHNQILEALRESEERFKTIFNEAPLGIALIDSLTGHIYQVNPMFAKIAGRTLEQMADIDWIDLTHPDDVQKDVDQMALLNAGKIAGFQTEKRYLHLDGTAVWINMAIAPLKGGHKALPRHLCMIEDITERKRVEEELRKYKDHLEEVVQRRTADLALALSAAEAANRAKSVFLSSMSHELRTPMNAILGFSSMLRKDPRLTKEQRENLDIINRSGEHLLSLINDVLEIARIEAGRAQLEIAPLDLGNLVRDVIDMMQARAQEKGLQLLVDQSSKFPRYIKSDETRLRQVLINLVGNAVKFTEHGGITLRLGMKSHDGPQRLLIEVEDSGIGIAPEDQEKIFEPFVQLGQTASAKGTGLGLTLTRQYLNLMGGTIGVESAPGKGSIFRVELPLEKVATADIVKPTSAIKGEIAGLAPGQPEYRILVVEDQLENQLLLAKLMSGVGLPVKVAENGEQAIGLFQSWRPHLIWMDRRMPVMDGLEATRRIRGLPGGKEVKIVAVTASAFTEQRDEMLNAGMDEFVRKPYRFNEIYECLARQLGVKFIYAEAPAAEEAGDAALTAEALTASLAALPPDLRRELHDALESLEGARIAAAIERVASPDAGLSKALSRLAENFDYPAILKALPANAA